MRTQLERLESRACKREERASRFDPASTDYRNLDDYIDKCQVPSSAWPGLDRLLRLALPVAALASH